MRNIKIHIHERKLAFECKGKEQINCWSNRILKVFILLKIYTGTTLSYKLK
jgi:hypothetical protein